MRAWQRPESRATPPEIVAVLGTTTLVRRPAEVTSLSARSVEGTAPEIDPQPSLPPTGGEDHGKAQGGIVVQSTVGFIKRRWGRPPHCRKTPHQPERQRPKWPPRKRQTDKALQSEKFKQVVGGLGEPQGKNPAPDQIRSP